MRFDTDTSKFESQFKFEANKVNAVTEIFINKNIWYDKTGFEVEVSEAVYPYEPVYASVNHF